MDDTLNTTNRAQTWYIDGTTLEDCWPIASDVGVYKVYFLIGYDHPWHEDRAVNNALKLFPRALAVCSLFRLVMLKLGS